jgi:hypothetical protein
VNSTSPVSGFAAWRVVVVIVLVVGGGGGGSASKNPHHCASSSSSSSSSKKNYCTARSMGQGMLSDARIQDVSFA